MKSNILLALVLGFSLIACQAPVQQPVSQEPTSVPATENEPSVVYADRQQIGIISFQTLEEYSVETDGFGGIYMGSPDAEISIMFMSVPTDSFSDENVARNLGARFPEESVALEILVILGFGNMQLGGIETFHFGDYDGYKRSFVALSDANDPMEGEYLFFPVGDQTFVALGTVVRVEGENRWEPQGKEAFFAVLDTVEFLPR